MRLIYFTHAIPEKISPNEIIVLLLYFIFFPNFVTPATNFPLFRGNILFLFCKIFIYEYEILLSDDKLYDIRFTFHEFLTLRNLAKGNTIELKFANPAQNTSYLFPLLSIYC